MPHYTFFMMYDFSETFLVFGQIDTIPTLISQGLLIQTVLEYLVLFIISQIQRKNYYDEVN